MKIRKKVNRNTMEYLAYCYCQNGTCSCSCPCICACSGIHQPSQKSDATLTSSHYSSARLHLFYDNNMSSHDAHANS